MSGRRVLLRAAVVGTAVVMLAAACAPGVRDRQVLEVPGVSADGRSFEFMVASCNGNPTAEVDELDDEVVVRVTGGTTNDDCADTVCIELDQPLDGRELIDASTGERVPVGAYDSDPSFVSCP